MKAEDIYTLLKRAAAVIYTPDGFTSEEKQQVYEDLINITKDIDFLNGETLSQNEIDAMWISANGDCDECHKAPGKPHKTACTKHSS